MKKTLAAVVAGVLIFAASAYADYRSGYTSPRAKDTKTDTSAFNGSLTTSDIDVQRALDRLDDAVGASFSDFHDDYHTTSFADDQIFVADDVNGGTPRTLPSCSGANNALTYNIATNSFSCNTVAGDSGWTHSAPNVTLATSTEDVGIGGTPVGKLTTIGTADKVQDYTKGYSTQTSNIREVRKSDNTLLESLTNGAVWTLGGTGTASVGLGTITLTDDTDGEFRITANGDGSDEDLRINLDDTANTAVVSSGTSLNNISLSSIDLTVPTEAYDATGWNGDNSVPTKDAVRDKIETLGSGTQPTRELIWPASATLPLEAADSIPPISKDAGTNFDQLVVDFDADTDECRQVDFDAPSDMDTSGTVTFTVKWYSAAATTGNIIWDFRHNSGVAEGADPDQAPTTETASADAVQGTTGQITVTTWTETVANLGWAQGDSVSGTFCRDANNASDTLTGDARTKTFKVSIPRA